MANYSAILIRIYFCPNFFIMSIPNKLHHIERHNLVSILRKWGSVSTGGILDDNCLLYTDPSIPGLIGYRLVGNIAVVLGDPVTAPEQKGELALSFQQFCSTQAIDIIFIIASVEFSLWAQEFLSPVLIEFGTTLFLNPCNNPYSHSGAQFKPLRKKVHNCLHKGVIVKEYIDVNLDIEDSITEIVASWQGARKGPQIHLCRPTPFNDRNGKRWFYAELDGKIIGNLILNELKQDKSWLLNNVMIKENSPNGLSELLVISALNALEIEGCTSVTIGPVPKNQLGEITGLNGLFTFITQAIYKGSKYFFNLGGHETFWDKFQPRREGSYLIFPHKNLNYNTLKAIINSLQSD